MTNWIYCFPSSGLELREREDFNGQSRLRVSDKPHHSGNTKRRGGGKKYLPPWIYWQERNKTGSRPACSVVEWVTVKTVYQVQKMPLQKKKVAMKEKKSRYICLRQGHKSAECKSNLNCLICGKRYSVTMWHCTWIKTENKKGIWSKAKRPTELSLWVLPTAILRKFYFKRYS